MNMVRVGVTDTFALGILYSVVLWAKTFKHTNSLQIGRKALGDEVTNSTLCVTSFFHLSGADLFFFVWASGPEIRTRKYGTLPFSPYMLIQNTFLKSAERRSSSHLHIRYCCIARDAKKVIPTYFFCGNVLINRKSQKTDILPYIQYNDQMCDKVSMWANDHQLFDMDTCKKYVLVLLHSLMRTMVISLNDLM